MNDDTRRMGPLRDSGLSDAPTGQLRAPATVSVEVAGRTDKGRVRPGNEDAFGLEPPTSALAKAHGTLLIVSDGMGGHAAGEVASKLAVETIKATYYKDDHSASTGEAIQNAIASANTAIFNNAEEDSTRTGMGCTVVVMVLQGSNLTVGHVGDSRGYLIRGGRAHQITSDHSWVAMQVAEGVLTPEQAEHHPNRSLLMRALGRQPSVEVDVGEHQLQGGDVLLLCSDGLTGVVNDAEIGEYASRYAPQVAADQLVNLANQRGAPDNVTVVTAAITALGGAAAAAGTTQTMAAPLADALTPRMVQPPGSPLTAPTVRNPAAASAPPAGTPVVRSRMSGMARPVASAPARRGRGRWLAGSLAAFGLAAGLVLLTVLGPRTAGEPETPRATETAASKPAVTPTVSGQAAPVATVPPPLATGIPGLIPPAAGAAASPPVQPAAPQAPTTASPPPQAPAVTATPAGAAPPVSTAAAGAASKPGTTPTSTPATSGAETPPPDGAAAAADPAAGAPTDPDAVTDATEGEPNPDATDPAMTGEPGAGEPGTGDPAAQQPAAAPPPPTQPSQGPRFAPPPLPPGVSIPGSPPGLGASLATTERAAPRGALTGPFDLAGTRHYRQSFSATQHPSLSRRRIRFND